MWADRRKKAMRCIQTNVVTRRRPESGIVEQVRLCSTSHVTLDEALQAVKRDIEKHKKWGCEIINCNVHLEIIGD